MTKYFYDTEFLEDGHTIELISIGIVADDGREYYAVNREAPWHEIAINTFLTQNVLPSLPGEITTYFGDLSGRYTFELEENHPDVKPLWRIGVDVRNFLERSSSKPELWAYYSAYDHVRLAQLWGAMKNRPESIPMWTNDIMTLTTVFGIDEDELPLQENGHHNALEDARHVKTMYEWIEEKFDNAVLLTRKQ